ncbi:MULTISPECIES: hypothetical protein [Dickeya]|uniref:hypothetical protein n=1 Tax=Dickeya TaxID=204037 RepID=UPI00055309A5|nr:MULTISPECIES: hypothetical protein [Dickeya]
MSDEISIPSLISEDNPTPAPQAALANIVQSAGVQPHYAIPGTHANAFSGLQEKAHQHVAASLKTGISDNNVPHKKRRGMLIRTQTSNYFANAKKSFSDSSLCHTKLSDNAHRGLLIGHHRGTQMAYGETQTLISKIRISQYVKPQPHNRSVVKMSQPR